VRAGRQTDGRRRARLLSRPVFFVWTTPERGTRSAWMARELGIDDVQFVGSVGRGFRRALFAYPMQLIRTLRVLLRSRPRVVFVQSPPSYAAWTVAIYCVATGATFVIDAHSDSFERARWTRPAWLTRFVARRALVTIVTNEHWAVRVRSWGAEPMTIPTIPTDLVIGEPPAMKPGANIAVVNTWAADEPLGEVLSAAEDLPAMSFFITGRMDSAAGLRRKIPSNVTFTGLLSQADYHGLLAASDTVVCLTTRNHTMQNGACEAMFIGTPILTSDWPVLREYFAGGAVYVDNTAAGIRDGLRHLIGSIETYRRDIRELRLRREREWQESRRALIDRINNRRG
jgi:glycosyltransferase involved in cell wall biosynthesis